MLLHQGTAQFELWTGQPAPLDLMRERLEAALAARQESADDASSWLDFSALPPFEQMSKYLGIEVRSGAWNSEGFMLRSFTPTPK